VSTIIIKVIKKFSQNDKIFIIFATVCLEIPFCEKVLERGAV
jgi:hypothetical protein